MAVSFIDIQSVAADTTATEKYSGFRGVHKNNYINQKAKNRNYRPSPFLFRTFRHLLFAIDNYSLLYE
jgi:hypothetical protein